VAVFALASFFGALVLVGPTDSTTEEIQGEVLVYGSAPSEFGELWLPQLEDGEDAPLVVLIHGGFWSRRGGDLWLMSPLARSLSANGYAVWNVEYGRVGERFGGWPHTFDHVAAALDVVPELAATYPIDPERVAVVGHSAGGHLALWSGGRDQLGSVDPGEGAVVEPSFVIALAPVADLHAAASDAVGNDAVVKLLGGAPDEVPERYRVAGSVGRAEDILLVLGELDDTVPNNYTRLPSEIGSVAEVVLPGVGHLGLIDPDTITPVLLTALGRWAQES
jgi:acetyl esterase/lipase